MTEQDLKDEKLRLEHGEQLQKLIKNLGDQIHKLAETCRICIVIGAVGEGEEFIDVTNDFQKFTDIQDAVLGVLRRQLTKAHAEFAGL